jgi:hypothetical protein
MMTCPACGAPADEKDLWCRLAFEQCLVWDFTDAQAGAVHHLTVLCYHLQHPHLYSHAGLDHAKHLLHEFLIMGKSPESLRQEIRHAVQSDVRNFKISATETDKGAYHQPIIWSFTAYDAMGDGIEGYPERVHQWAHGVYEALVGAGEMG